MIFVPAWDKYQDFSIAHIFELLETRQGIKITRETLRRWLERPQSLKPKKQRTRRECSPKFGNLLQIDGLFDTWFGSAINNDWGFGYKGELFQIPRQSPCPPAKAKIKIRAYYCLL